VENILHRCDRKYVSISEYNSTLVIFKYSYITGYPSFEYYTTLVVVTRGGVTYWSIAALQYLNIVGTYNNNKSSHVEYKFAYDACCGVGGGNDLSKKTFKKRNDYFVETGCTLYAINTTSVVPWRREIVFFILHCKRVRCISTRRRALCVCN